MAWALARMASPDSRSSSALSAAASERSRLLRFLRAYLPGGLRQPAIWKPLWSKLSRRAAQKIARNLKLKRPIT